MATDLLEKHKEELLDDGKQKTKKYDDSLQKKVKDLISLKRLTMTTVAKGINMSPATLSQYLKSNYDGDIGKVENELQKFVKFFTQKDDIENKKLKFEEINTVKKVFNAANMCQLRGKMGVVYGSPGIGKTTAINEYQKNITGVIVVDPIENTSIRAVLENISDQLKLNYYQNITIEEFTNNIIKKLEKNKHLIIIDEAENLKVDIFKILRKIHDKTQNCCGILFVGTEVLFQLLLGIKHGFPYVTSRIGYIAKIDTLTPDDVEKLVLQYYPFCKKDVIKYIAKICKFNARAIQNLLDLCFDITNTEKIELNKDVIDSAKENLLI